MQDIVLIIDDEKKLCNLMARIIELEGLRYLRLIPVRMGSKF